MTAYADPFAGAEAGFFQQRALNKQGSGGGSVAREQLQLQKQQLRQSNIGQMESARQFDAQFAEGQRQFGMQHSFGVSRAQRSDFESDRGFGLAERQQNEAERATTFQERMRAMMTRMEAAAPALMAEQQRLVELRDRIHERFGNAAADDLQLMDEQYDNDQQDYAVGLEAYARRQQELAGFMALHQMTYGGTMVPGPDGKPMTVKSKKDALYEAVDRHYQAQQTQAMLMYDSLFQKLKTLPTLPVQGKVPGMGFVPEGLMPSLPYQVPEHVLEAVSGAVSPFLASVADGAAPGGSPSSSATQSLVTSWMRALERMDPKNKDSVENAAKMAEELKRQLGGGAYGLLVHQLQSVTSSVRGARQAAIAAAAGAGAEGMKGAQEMQGKDGHDPALSALEKIAINAGRLRKSLVQAGVFTTAPGPTPTPMPKPYDVDVPLPSVVAKIDPATGKVTWDNAPGGQAEVMNIIDKAVLKLYELDPDEALRVVDAANNPTLKSRFSRAILADVSRTLKGHKQEMDDRLAAFNAAAGAGANPQQPMTYQDLRTKGLHNVSHTLKADEAALKARQAGSARRLETKKKGRVNRAKRDSYNAYDIERQVSQGRQDYLRQFLDPANIPLR